MNLYSISVHPIILSLFRLALQVTSRNFMSTRASSSQVPESPSGPSGLDDNIVNVYVTLHDSGNPNADFTINAALPEWIHGMFCTA